MSFFPQIGSGVITQLPFQRTRNWRAITNQMESGELITLPDTSGGQMSWSLKYEDLNSAESQAIASLFASSQGQFGTFTFIDPMANLLGWSETLTGAGWQASGLTIASGVSDPLGTQRASAVSNNAQGSLSLQQTLGISGDYVACFSCWVQAAAAGSITISRDGAQKAVRVGPQWSRVFIAGTGTSGAAQSLFSLTLAAGQSVSVFGLQVEAQPSPSVYKPTQAASGIYEQTWFASDELTVTSTAPGLSRVSLSLISRI